MCFKTGRTYIDDLKISKGYKSLFNDYSDLCRWMDVRDGSCDISRAVVLTLALCRVI